MESWSNEELKKQDDEYDLSSESGKWKGLSSGLSEDSDKGGQKSLSISQTGSWRRGMSAQIGTTSSRHKSGSSSLKTPGTEKIHIVIWPWYLAVVIIIGNLLFMHFSFLSACCLFLCKRLKCPGKAESQPKVTR